MKDWSASLIVLMIGNASITVFYLAFWLLGWWIPALEQLNDAADERARLFWPAVWFVSFFVAIFLSIKPCIKRPIFSVSISAGIAFGFSFLWYALIAAAHLLLAPFFDPMF